MKSHPNLPSQTPIHCFCINLDERPDKWDELQAAFQHTAISIERFPGVKHEVGWKGCGAAHVAVAAEAARRGLPWVLVLEDDCLPSADFAERWPALQEQLWLSRDSWDIFLGGPTYVQGPVSRIGGTDSSSALVELGKAYALQFYVLQARAYPVMQSWVPEKDGPIDVFTSNRFRIATTYPVIASQRPSKSDIRGEYIDYTDHFEETDVKLRSLLYAYDTRWATFLLLAISGLTLFALRRKK